MKSCTLLTFSGEMQNGDLGFVNGAVEEIALNVKEEGNVWCIGNYLPSRCCNTLMARHMRDGKDDGEP